MRIATPPVFWVQKVPGTSTVRKKWSHNTLAGSAWAGQPSGTGTGATKGPPLHVTLGFDGDTVPPGELGACTGIETTETIRTSTARLQRHQTRKGPDSPRARANRSDTEPPGRPVMRVGTRTGSFLDGNHLRKWTLSNLRGRGRRNSVGTSLRMVLRDFRTNILKRAVAFSARVRRGLC